MHSNKAPSLPSPLPYPAFSGTFLPRNTGRLLRSCRKNRERKQQVFPVIPQLYRRWSLRPSRYFSAAPGHGRRRYHLRREDLSRVVLQEARLLFRPAQRTDPVHSRRSRSAALLRESLRKAPGYNTNRPDRTDDRKRQQYPECEIRCVSIRPDRTELPEGTHH